MFFVLNFIIILEKMNFLNYFELTLCIQFVIINIAMSELDFLRNYSAGGDIMHTVIATKSISEFYKWMNGDEFFHAIPLDSKKKFLAAANNYFEELEKIKVSNAYKTFSSIPEIYIWLSNILKVFVKYLNIYDLSEDAKNLSDLLIECLAQQIDEHSTIELFSTLYKKIKKNLGC